MQPVLAVDAAADGPRGEVDGVDAPEERAALGRHGFDEVVVEVQAVPLRPDGVIAVEDGDSVYVRVLPGRGCMEQGLGEEEDGACGTGVGFEVGVIDLTKE